MPVTVVAMTHVDPQEGVHRQSPPSRPEVAAARPFYRHPTSQTLGRYHTPYAPNTPAQEFISAVATGFPDPTKRVKVPAGYSDELDYGKPPQRVPRSWRDAISCWAGLSVHGDSSVGLVASVNHWMWLPHLRPTMPTRGYRSISGVVSRQGPTASNARIPAVFVPSSVG